MTKPMRGCLPYPPYLNLALRDRVDAFDAWDLAQRKRLGWRAGLKLMRRDSGGSLMIASRHWPHLLCWQWILSWQGRRYGKPQFFRFWRNGPGVTGGFSMGLRLFWLGQFVLQRQASDRIAAFGQPTAPAVYDHAS